jgi:hypothetical protein
LRGRKRKELLVAGRIEGIQMEITRYLHHDRGLLIAAMPEIRAEKNSATGAMDF